MDVYYFITAYSWYYLYDYNIILIVTTKVLSVHITYLILIM